MDNYLKKFNTIYEQKCSNKYLPSNLPAVGRIIVIGDIHGDMEKLLKCLKIAKLIDNNNDSHINWIGGDSVVVQVGDQIDSCRINCNQISNDNADDIKILYFLTELHNKAAKKGGAIYSLMGNHEFMNVLGDFSYVSHSNIRAFDKIVKTGEEVRRDEFAPGNRSANFLACTRKMALIIGSNLFVHGGIIPEMVNRYSIDDMNKLLALFLFDEFKQPTIFQDLFINAETSPFWTRKFGMYINNCNSLLEPLEQVYKVGKIFVGHTPQMRTGIRSQCNNKVWLTDVGMSRAFDFNMHSHLRDAQVLEILNDGETINILK